MALTPEQKAALRALLSDGEETPEAPAQPAAPAAPAAEAVIGGEQAEAPAAPPKAEAPPDLAKLKAENSALKALHGIELPEDFTLDDALKHVATLPDGSPIYTGPKKGDTAAVTKAKAEQQVVQGQPPSHRARQGGTEKAAGSKGAPSRSDAPGTGQGSFV